MKSTPGKPKPTAIVKRTTAPITPVTDFDDVLAMIQAARVQTAAAVNTALIDLYWSIGQHIYQKVANDGWGQGTVATLADYIRSRLPNARLLRAKPLADAPVFRHLSEQSKTLTTGERIALDSQLADPHGHQA